MQHNNMNGNRATAFNRGCDARLAGLPITANPHRTLCNSWFAWQDGWLDVDKHFCRTQTGAGNSGLTIYTSARPAVVIAGENAAAAGLFKDERS